MKHQTPRWHPNLLGPYEPGNSRTPVFPTLRPTYNIHTARALHALAESNPTPDEYHARKKAILADQP
jgi:hypothetical protein